MVSYNCASFVNRLFGCLLAQTEQDFELVLVDNASADAAEIAMPDDSRFTLIRLDRNLGFAAANNLGARGARTEWIVTLNPDAFPDPDWLARLYEAARRHPEAAMFGSTQLFEHDPGLLDGAGDLYSVFGVARRIGYRTRAVPPYRSGEVFSPCAAAAMYRRDAFEAAQGFDKDFFCYCEDVDLGFRIRLAGGMALQVGEAVVHHVSSGVSSQYGTFALYHGIRNQIWTLVKNVPSALLPLALCGHAAALAVMFALRWRGEEARAAGRGIRDALRGLGGVLAKRRKVQRARRASLGAVARVLTWNPLAVLRRG
ncbi:glycosyltransferase family 2 protein [Azospirillum sp. SYSU D00513]|uniref:glycosyltransferase family 2 protein n=1 Tax=Azospirillum sp. SYSU D00513 TaxID=2812561 RepID=UPI0032B4D55A